MFLQKINLKADPTEINPAFQLEFSPKAQARINESKQAEEALITQAQQEPQEVSISQIEDNQNISPSQEIKIEDIYSEAEEIDTVENIEDLTIEEQETISFGAEPTEIENTFDFSEPKQPIIPNSPFAPVSQSDLEAKELLVQAKNTDNNAQGDTKALNLLNEALGILENSEDLNENIRAAIHLERGKIFDNYDYVDYALRDYFEATKAQDLNLKAQDFFKTAQVYDEFSEFSPAFDNYLSSVAYTGEADNQNAQTIVLSKIASLFTKQFDIDNTKNYSELAINVAQSTQDDDLIAQTHSQMAQNYQYLGQNDDAIKSYRNALEIFSRKEESIEEMAYNYEQAAQVMESLGNRAKAEKLRAKANLYYQKSQLFSDQQVKAS